MLDRDIAETIAATMLNAAIATTRDYAAEDVGDENDFSSQLIGQIKARLSNLTEGGIRWRVTAVNERDEGPPIPSIRFSSRRLQSSGPSSEEKQLGADLLMVLDIDMPDYQISKGVLIQAKRLERGRRLRSRKAKELQSQCQDMLTVTPASFVFLYGHEDLTVLSATRVLASDRRDLHALEVYSPEVFFVDFLVCWIGDPIVSATDRDALIQLRALASFCRETPDFGGQWRRSSMLTR